MLVGDVIYFARQLLNDPNPQGRYSDAAMLNFYNMAAQQLFRDIKFPESRLVAQTVPGQQEYELPEVVEIYRVYAAGQLLVPTTIQDLEGDLTQDYDQGFSSGVVQQTPPSGSGGPPGVVPGYSPAWVVQTAQTYPVANRWGFPAPDAQPWFAGQRPRYYLRGGYLGLVPPPATAVTLVVEGLVPPAFATSDAQVSLFPRAALEALAWKMAVFARYADDSDRSQQDAMIAEQMYAKRMGELREDIRRRDSQAPRGPRPSMQRRLWYKGNVRNAPSGNPGTGGGEW